MFGFGRERRGKASELNGIESRRHGKAVIRFGTVRVSKAAASLRTERRRRSLESTCNGCEQPRTEPLRKSSDGK